MKKFLIYYFILLIFACIFILILGIDTKREQIVQVETRHRKKIVVISTVEKEPIARVVRESENCRLFFEWMAVRDAVIVMEEEIARSNGQDRRFSIYLQYENCPIIY